MSKVLQFSRIYSTSYPLFIRSSISPICMQLAKTSSDSEQVRLTAQTEMQEYWEKNMNSKRPWSPHLTIYKMELPMFTSLLHRGSGIAMAIAWAGIGIGAYAYTGNYEALMNYIASLSMSAPILFGAKFIMSWPLVYHYTNGMRHLAYDGAKGFEINTTMKTGYIALAISVAIATGFSCITLK